MKDRLDRSIAGPGREPNELLCYRMAILGLDRKTIERSDGATFDKLSQRCAGCDFPDACAIDLTQDPSSPVWEAYCPNSGLLNVLTETL